MIRTCHITQVLGPRQEYLEYLEYLVLGSVLGSTTGAMGIGLYFDSSLWVTVGGMPGLPRISSVTEEEVEGGQLV
jgi:hypothetical protein